MKKMNNDNKLNRKRKRNNKKPIIINIDSDDESANVEKAPAIKFRRIKSKKLAVYKANPVIGANSRRNTVVGVKSRPISTVSKLPSISNLIRNTPSTLDTTSSETLLRKNRMLKRDLEIANQRFAVLQRKLNIYKRNIKVHKIIQFLPGVMEPRQSILRTSYVHFDKQSTVKIQISSKTSTPLYKSGVSVTLIVNGLTIYTKSIETLTLVKAESMGAFLITLNYTFSKGSNMVILDIQNESLKESLAASFNMQLIY